MIGIIILKINKRIVSFLKIFVLKILYIDRFQFGRNLILYPGCRIILDQNGKIKIGSNVFLNHGCSLTSLKQISIGDNCIFGENVKVYDHNHGFTDKTLPMKKQPYSVQEVSIGNNVWIGSNTVVLKGVTIGDNVVIGAGSVIQENIPDDSIVYNERKNCIKKIIYEDDR